MGAGDQVSFFEGSPMSALAGNRLTAALRKGSIVSAELCIRLVNLSQFEGVGCLSEQCFIIIYN